MNGILNLDKPAGITSAHAVNRVKRLIPRGTKIGHAGTLDPFATGVLLLLIGKATKLCEKLMGAPKQYETTVRFGATTATDDLESPEEPYAELVRPISRQDLIDVLPRFIGAIQQRPPVYSALKVSGKRACDRVRAGETILVQPRTVNIHGIELLEFNWPFARLRIDCGRGTYIRSIARDMGETLGVGGYLRQLRRTGIGEFAIENSVSLNQLTSESVASHLHPLQLQ